MSWSNHTRSKNYCTDRFIGSRDCRYSCPVKARNTNCVMRKLRKTLLQCPWSNQIDTDLLHQRLYADAFVANYYNISSQLGVLTVICDKRVVYHVLNHRRYKSERVVRSIVGREVCKFMDGFDCIHNLEQNYNYDQNGNFRIFMYIDSRQLFNAMSCGKHSSKRRFTIVITATRQAYCRFQISGIALVSSEENPADERSGVKGNRAQPNLRCLLKIILYISKV